MWSNQHTESELSRAFLLFPSFCCVGKDHCTWTSRLKCREKSEKNPALDKAGLPFCLLLFDCDDLLLYVHHHLLQNCAEKHTHTVYPFSIMICDIHFFVERKIHWPPLITIISNGLFVMIITVIFEICENTFYLSGST